MLHSTKLNTFCSSIVIVGVQLAGRKTNLRKSKKSFKLFPMCLSLLTFVCRPIFSEMALLNIFAPAAPFISIVRNGKLNFIHCRPLTLLMPSTLWAYQREISNLIPNDSWLSRNHRKTCSLEKVVLLIGYNFCPLRIGMHGMCPHSGSKLSFLFYCPSLVIERSNKLRKTRVSN